MTLDFGFDGQEQIGEWVAAYGCVAGHTRQQACWSRLERHSGGYAVTMMGMGEAGVDGNREKWVAALAPMEANGGGGGGRRVDEGSLMCGMLQGWRCLALDGGRGRGLDHGPGDQVDWAVVAGFARYAFTVGRRFL
jgi:hypothetical protein